MSLSGHTVPEFAGGNETTYLNVMLYIVQILRRSSRDTRDRQKGKQELLLMGKPHNHGKNKLRKDRYHEGCITGEIKIWDVLIMYYRSKYHCRQLPIRELKQTPFLSTRTSDCQEGIGLKTVFQTVSLC